MGDTTRDETGQSAAEKLATQAEVAGRSTARLLGTVGTASGVQPGGTEPPGGTGVGVAGGGGAGTPGLLDRAGSGDGGTGMAGADTNDGAPGGGTV